MYDTIILPYTAVLFSVVARFIFMYLLYTKKSTNIYSLSFCCLSIISSSIWIPYGIIVNDIPIIVRSGIEIILLSSSGIYIIRNRCLDLPPLPPPKIRVRIRGNELYSRTLRSGDRRIGRGSGRHGVQTDVLRYGGGPIVRRWRTLSGPRSTGQTGRCRSSGPLSRKAPASDARTQGGTS